MFKSVVWSSTIDYPEQVSTVLFVGTCNWNCDYCYNQNLINKPSIDFNSVILPKLIQRKNFINHIVISGGECTCYDQINNIIVTLVDKGFKIGIHTNGSNPDKLTSIINEISFVGMDIKTGNWSNYDNLTHSKVNCFDIINSIKTIINSKVEYEFRTTLYPYKVTLEDCLNIANILSINGANKYVLQQYDNSFNNNPVKPYPNIYIQQIKEVCNKIIPTVIKGDG